MWAIFADTLVCALARNENSNLVTIIKVIDLNRNKNEIRIASKYKFSSKNNRKLEGKRFRIKFEDLVSNSINDRIPRSETPIKSKMLRNDIEKVIAINLALSDVSSKL